MVSTVLDTPDLHSKPRFLQAPEQARHLVRLCRLALAGAGGLWLLALLVGLFSPDAHWVPLLRVNAAALLLLAAAGHSAWFIVKWRVEAQGQQPLRLAFWRNTGQVQDEDQPLSAFDRWLARTGDALARCSRSIGHDVLWLSGWSVLALALVMGSWRFDLPAPAAATQASWVAVGVLLALALALLIVERHLASASEADWPEAVALATVSRVVILVQVLSIPCLFFADGARLWPARLAVLIGILPGLLAVEFLVRALVAAFRPQRAEQEPALVARSLMGGMLQWPPRPLAALRGELQQRFGIDLQQVWAFGFMRRALLPVAALVALVGWLLSGVVQVPLEGRGVYERFGKPVQVYPPGLHVGLPWPFGRVLAVENGVIHELATSGREMLADPMAGAEGEAPMSANRLWDATHASDNAQVIAGSDDDRQSFQIVNMDVRFIYRIGLDDASALAATYHSAEVAQLVRSLANRVLLHDFANRTLDGVLGSEREALSRDIGKAVQADLDRLQSGVQILATSVEAIHPPAGAANAYHGVQAAQITAQALIARDRGQAAEQTGQARQNAALLVDQAAGSAHEALAKAQAAELGFNAERSAWRQAGAAFVLEQYLARLREGLSNSKALIIDHRISAGQAPTLDLRTFAAPVDPATSKHNQERTP